MSSILVHVSYVVWVLCAVVAAISLVYNYNRARFIRKWLRQDYGEECCRCFQGNGKNRSSSTRTDTQSEEGKEL